MAKRAWQGDIPGGLLRRTRALLGGREQRAPVRPSLWVYLGVWIGGLLVGTLPLSNAVDRQVSAVLGGGMPPLGGTLLVCGLIWSAVVYLTMVWVGFGSASYDQYFSPFKSIWALVTLVLLALVLVNVVVFKNLQDRVDGLRADITFARMTLETLADSTRSTREHARAVLDLAFGASPPDMPQPTAASVAERLPAVRYYAKLADKQAAAVLDLLTGAQPGLTDPAADSAAKCAIDPEPASAHPAEQAQLGQVVRVICLTHASTIQVTRGVDRWEAEQARVLADPTTSLDRLLSIVGEQVYLNADEATREVLLAQQVFSAVEPPLLDIFAWLGAFYALLLLVPWILLLLFLIRKRDSRAVQILSDLYRLDPSRDLLRRALGLNQPARPEDLQPNTDPRSSAPGTPPAFGQGRSERIKRLRESVEHIGRQAPVGGVVESGEDVRMVVEELANRAFSNFEYGLSLLLLTAGTALGWYFVFYPQTIVGLASLMESGGDIGQVTAYLVRAPSPVTFGFIGGYFFAIQMLLRRYVAGDLYPSAYLQAAERLIEVFILSLVLSVIGAAVHPVAGGMAVLAFMAGVFPRAGLRWIASWVNKVMASAFPSTMDTPPSKLEGINLFTETRLVEEKIDNVQSIATASIEALVLRTNFSTQQVVDWIDQAILYMHAGNDGELFTLLRMAGIRTASDLLDVAGVLECGPDGVDPRATPSTDILERLAQAVGGGACLLVPASDQTSPGSAAEPDDAPHASSRLVTSDMLWAVCQALRPDPNIQYILNYYGHQLVPPTTSPATKTGAHDGAVVGAPAAAVSPAPA